MSDQQAKEIDTDYLWANKTSEIKILPEKKDSCAREVFPMTFSPSNRNVLIEVFYSYWTMK